jgi:CRISPR-associated protein Cas1
MIEEPLRTIWINGYGIGLGKKDEMLKVTREGKAEEYSLQDMEQVVVEGEVSITTGAMRLLSDWNVDLVVIDEWGRKFLRMNDVTSSNSHEILESQLALPEECRMEIAREIVSASIYNKSRLLSQIEGAEMEQVSAVAAVRKKAAKAATRDVLMGFEGVAAKLYFAELRKQIPDAWEFEGRNRQPPKDPINAMLGYGYAVLKTRIEFALMRVGLSPYAGVYHESYRARPALAFDLMEEFRQPIVDRSVMTIVRHQMLDPVKDFARTDESCLLSKEAKKPFINALFDRMESRRKYGNREVDFLDLIEMQARALRGAFEGGVYRPFKWR